MKIKMWIRSKKGQMEIMGLAIVLILVTLGFLFMVQFTSKPDISSQVSYEQIQLAANLKNVFLDTTTANCHGHSVKALVQDCVTGSTIFCEDGKDSCNYATDMLDELLGLTLVSWNRKFDIKICELELASGECKAGTLMYNLSNDHIIGTCSILSEGRTQIQYIPTQSKIYSMVLRLCV